MPTPSGKDFLEWHIGFRDWMHAYPELFETRLHKDCFLRLALLTIETQRIESLKPLYRGLPYAENSIRAYLRSLSNAGWIRFEAPSSGDRRMVSLRIEAPFRKALQDYLQHFERLVSKSGGKDGEPQDAADMSPEIDPAAAQTFRVRA